MVGISVAVLSKSLDPKTGDKLINVADWEPHNVTGLTKSTNHVVAPVSNKITLGPFFSLDRFVKHEEYQKQGVASPTLFVFNAFGSFVIRRSTTESSHPWWRPLADLIQCSQRRIGYARFWFRVNAECSA
jgi:hypothetical protein